MKRSLQIGKNRGFSGGSRPTVNSGQNAAIEFRGFFETSAAATGNRSIEGDFAGKFGQNSRFLPNLPEANRVFFFPVQATGAPAVQCGLHLFRDWVWTKEYFSECFGAAAGDFGMLEFDASGFSMQSVRNLNAGGSGLQHGFGHRQGAQLASLKLKRKQFRVCADSDHDF